MMCFITKTTEIIIDLLQQYVQNMVLMQYIETDGLNAV